MLSEFESGMLAGGACAIVSFIVIFFFLNSRGVFDPLKNREEQTEGNPPREDDIRGCFLFGRRVCDDRGVPLNTMKIARILIGIATIGVGIYILGIVLFSDEIDTPVLLFCIFLCCLCALTMMYRNNKSGTDVDQKHQSSEPRRSEPPRERTERQRNSASSEGPMWMSS